MKLDAPRAELQAALKALEYTLDTWPQLFNTWELEPAEAMRDRLRGVLEKDDSESKQVEALAELERINQRVLEIREDRSGQWLERETRGLKEDLTACGYGPRDDDD